MWRDITRCVSSSFIKIFLQLETDGVLDSTNELDIFCLHYIFLPRVNKRLLISREVGTATLSPVKVECPHFNYF